MRGMIYQCKTCGAVVRPHQRRAHLNDRHQQSAAAFTAMQVARAFTTTINPRHPGRADKWGYTDAEIRGIIPGLQDNPKEEVSDASTETRQGRA